MKHFIFFVLILLVFVPFSCERDNQKILVVDNEKVSLWVRADDKMDSLIATQTGLVLSACLKDPDPKLKVALSELLAQFALMRLKQLKEISYPKQEIEEDKL